MPDRSASARPASWRSAATRRGYLSINYELAPLLAIFAGIGVSLACALVLSVVTLRLRGLYLALATLAFGLLVDSCAVGFLDITGGPSGLVGIPSFSVAGFEFATPRAMYYVVFGARSIIFVVLIGGDALGIRARAQGDPLRPDGGGRARHQTVRYKLAAFMISVTLASLSGSMYAFFFNFLSPEMVGTGRSLELVAMLIVGGESTLLGGLFGALLLTLLPTMFQPLAIYKTFASGALLGRELPVFAARPLRRGRSIGDPAGGLTAQALRRAHLKRRRGRCDGLERSGQSIGR